jgi:hypothetical protein
MTFNKWTVALAAAGVVSLASVAHAEEKTSMAVSALTSTTISGYVDTSAQWNFGTGNGNLPPYRFGGSDKADGFNLNTVQLRLENPLDENEWAAGYRVDLWAGPDANTLGSQSILADGTSDFAIRQAYVALRMPVGNGLDWKVGVFDSILGYESIESPANPNFTRSYGHTLEPTTHTGALVSYRFNDLISASAGVANTYGPMINERAFEPFNERAESYKTYMGSIAITAPESLGFLAGSTLYGGIVNGFSGGYAGFDEFGDYQDYTLTSWYAGATIATPVTGLRVGAALDVLDVHDLSGESWSTAAYASYQATEKLSFHARGEYLRDRGNQKFFVYQERDEFGDVVGWVDTAPDQTLAITATAQYDLWKNVISRLELRWDHALSSPEVYGGSVPNTTDSPNGDKNAWMLVANLIYKF